MQNQMLKYISIHFPAGHYMYTKKTRQGYNNIKRCYLEQQQHRSRSSRLMKFRIECKSLTIDQFPHLLFRQSMLLEVKAKWGHAYWLVADVVQRVQVRMC